MGPETAFSDKFRVALLLLVPGSLTLHSSLNLGVSNSFVQKFHIEVVELVGICNANVFTGPSACHH